MKNLKFNFIEIISLSTKFYIQDGLISLGKGVGTRRNVEFRASNGGKLYIGDKCFFNNGCLVNSRNKISIGNNTRFGPNVLIYDHDHDFRVEGGINSQEYKIAPITIGKNVWIGANCIILRGSIIGDNSIVASGSVIKGKYDDNKIIIQKRITSVEDI